MQAEQVRRLHRASLQGERGVYHSGPFFTAHSTAHYRNATKNHIVGATPCDNPENILVFSPYGRASVFSFFYLSIYSSFTHGCYTSLSIVRKRCSCLFYYYLWAYLQHLYITCCWVRKFWRLRENVELLAASLSTGGPFPPMFIRFHSSMQWLS